jgi:predicted acetyltransferase
MLATMDERVEVPGMELRDDNDMHVEVLPATREQQPVLANLLELYAHDFSEITNVKIGADGRFGYGPLPRYWSESTRFPFLVRVNGELAGFVLVRRGSQISEAADIWDVAEFFVLRGYRRQRVGVRVAHEVWKKFPGYWEVRISDTNSAARAFWWHAVGEFTGMPAESAVVEIAGKRWHVLSFVSEPLPN